MSYSRSVDLFRSNIRGCGGPRDGSSVSETGLSYEESSFIVVNGKPFASKVQFGIVGL